MIKYIWQELSDGSFTLIKPEPPHDNIPDEGTDWDGDLLISTSDNVEILYDKDRLWRESIKNIGRNDKCPCNSNKKYKKCCINRETEE